MTCCKSFLYLFSLLCSSWPHQLSIGFYAMSIAIGVCKYKLISSCIIDRWLMMHKSTFVTCTYSFAIPIYFPRNAYIINTTAAVVYSWKTVDICDTCGLPLLYRIYHHQQTHYCHYVHNVFLPSRTLPLCIYY